MTIVYILTAILMFGVLIALHELGHFLAAKACGVQVNEFSIGMGPALFKRQRGETQYSLRVLPVGGYCAMEGEDEDSENPRAITRQSYWKQFIIFVAGSLSNFLTGFLILLILYSGAEAFYVPTVAGTAPEFTAAEEETLQAGDQLWAINGERIYVSGDVALIMRVNAGKEKLAVTVLRDGEKVSLTGIPLQTCTGQDGKPYQGYGFFYGNEAVPATALGKVKIAWYNTVDFVRTVRISLQMLARGDAGLKDMSGPVGIVSTITQVGQASESARDALDNILFFTALIAVNLAVMNLLPLPALDGGRVLFLTVDAIAMALFKKRIPEKYENAINYGGLVVLLGFMLIVTLHDVSRLFG
ncbi:site-2 protease family protein [Oscillibacter sp.]|uniref:M50 family metallopeptidase n=1 Tax=Oscillibacter sp. TaxID=1945593 RepID=UPI00289EB8BD|nr:site-2 protease family protein [Oscillibacter sp.]